MTAYFVMGIVTVAWALILAAVGLTRENFPPSGAGLRVIIAVSVALVAGTLVALLATTKKEHPRQEAAEKQAEVAGGAEQAPTKQEPVNKAAAKGGGTIDASEKEFSIALSGGDAVDAGKYTIDVANVGKVQHDLAVEGNGIDEAKTPLLDPGRSGKLSVDLGPGKYTLYCTVPGHEQSGMKVELTVK